MNNNNPLVNAGGTEEPVTVSNFSADNIRKGVAVTIVQDGKTIYSVTGAYGG